MHVAVGCDKDTQYLRAPSIRLEVLLCTVNACLLCSLHQDLGVIDELALQVT